VLLFIYLFQELEAYVDDIDIDNDFRKDDFYYLSQEDKERQKREQEESKRVLQELKTVLGFKASEAERQKWKQLLFSDHGKHQLQKGNSFLLES
jgi:hypothetical protein